MIAGSVQAREQLDLSAGGWNLWRDTEAAWPSMGCRLGTAVGVVPVGEGKIILSTLEICPAINEPAGPADIARKLLVNYLEATNAQN